MDSILDFLSAALPYVFIGLSVGLVLSAYSVSERAKKEGKKSSKYQVAYSQMAASSLMYAASLMSWIGTHSNTSAAITFMCCGSMFLCLGAASLNKANKEKSQEDNTRDKDDTIA